MALGLCKKHGGLLGEYAKILKMIATGFRQLRNETTFANMVATRGIS